MGLNDAPLEQSLIECKSECDGNPVALSVIQKALVLFLWREPFLLLGVRNFAYRQFDKSAAVSGSSCFGRTGTDLSGKREVRTGTILEWGRLPRLHLSPFFLLGYLLARGRDDWGTVRI